MHCGGVKCGSEIDMLHHLVMTSMQALEQQLMQVF